MMGKTWPGCAVAGKSMRDWQEHERREGLRFAGKGIRDERCEAGGKGKRDAGARLKGEVWGTSV